ncbi:hypothetical protein K9M78_02495 [Candidatus Bipolaricaulota bacterium]|nr:hypothetical protein [Candidatus Bipolaricaulota bacterium]
MTDRVSGLFVLFFTVLLIVSGGPFINFQFRIEPTFGAIPVIAEELQCPSCSLMKASFPAAELSEWKTFRSEAHGFGFKYPPAGRVQTYSDTHQRKVRVDLPVTGETLLQEKFFLVKVEKVSERNPDTTPGEEPGKEVSINDRTFDKKEFEEGAAGHLYEHTIYSTVEGNSRFVLDFVLHSINPGVFDSPPPDFDRSQANVFSGIASTFRFLDRPYSL